MCMAHSEVIEHMTLEFIQGMSYLHNAVIGPDWCDHTQKQPY